MPIRKNGLNITLDSTTSVLLERLAKHERKSVSGLAKELILDPLECCEDKFFAGLAERRDREGKNTINHKHVWKRPLQRSL